MRQSGCRLIGFSFGKDREPRNRMKEIFTSGSVGRAPGNRRFYPEAYPQKRRFALLFGATNFQHWA